MLLLRDNIVYVLLHLDKHMFRRRLVFLELEVTVIMKSVWSEWIGAYGPVLTIDPSQNQLDMRHAEAVLSTC